MPPTQSQSVTPAWKDKALWVTVLGLLLPVLSAKLGVQLDPDKVAGILILAASYVIAHKGKSAAIVVAEIKAAAVRAVAVLGASSAGMASAAGAAVSATDVCAVQPGHAVERLIVRIQFHADHLQRATGIDALIGGPSFGSCTDTTPVTCEDRSGRRFPRCARGRSRAAR